MSLPRVCSECPNLLVSKSAQAKTCSEKCRSARSRRLRRIETEQAGLDQYDGVREIAAFVRRESPDVAKDVLRKEITPIVRQALTEDVLRAIEKLVGLTPRAVAAMTDDLESDDKVIRQRAYTTLLKYTVGHQALVKAEDTEDKSQLVVHFNLPRPDAEPDIVEAESEEIKTCDLCKQEKPAAEFESGSDRCTSCFEEWKRTIKAQILS